MRERKGWARLATVGAVGAVAVATLAAPAASGDPVRRIQTVEVKVAPDGAISAISVVDLTRSAEGGEERRDQRSLDPSERGPDLPVSVQLSWTAGDRVGTDISDVAGVEGPVELQLTVVNQTGRPTELEVVDPLTQATVETTAIVYEPLTVVATAQLPGGSSMRVDRDRTNGVLAVKDGATVVQWGAVLAPPASGGAATFVLAVDTDDFRIEQFGLTVEPGLAQDFALDRIVQEVFGPRPINNDQVIRRFTTGLGQSLGQASSGLDAVRTELRRVTVERVNQIVDTLLDATSDLNGQIDELVAEVERLRVFQQATLQSLDDADLAQEQAVGALIAAIGRPSDPLPEGDLQQLARDGRLSVMQAIKLLQDRIGDLPGEPDRVTDDLLSFLIERIGPITCVDPSAHNLQCLIDALLQDQLAAQAAFIAEIQHHLDTFETAAVGDAGAIDGLVDDIDASLETLGQVGAGLDEAADSVEEGNAGVGGARDALDDARTSLQGTIATLSDLHDRLAVARTGLSDARGWFVVDALDGVESVPEAVAAAAGVRSELVLRISQLVTLVCEDVPDDLLEAIAEELGGPVPDDLAAAVAASLAPIAAGLAGTDCEDVPAELDGVAELLDQLDLGAIEDASDDGLVALDASLAEVDDILDDLAPAIAELEDLDDDLAAVAATLVDADTAGDVAELLAAARDVLATARAALGTGDESGLARDLGDLREDVESLGSSIEQFVESLEILLADNGVEPPDGDGHTDLAEGTEARFLVLQQAAQTTFDLGRARIEAALAEVSEQVQPIFDRSIGALERATTETAAALDRIAAQVTATIEARVASSTATLEATRARLREGTTNVFLNLVGAPQPDRNATDLAPAGYQGLLRDQLVAIDQNREFVDAGRADSSSFSGVRHATALARATRAAQQQAGLARSLRAGLFDGAAPDGSAAALVFVFTLPAVGG